MPAAMRDTVAGETFSDRAISRKDFFFVAAMAKAAPLPDLIGLTVLYNSFPNNATCCVKERKMLHDSLTKSSPHGTIRTVQRDDNEQNSATSDNLTQIQNLNTEENSQIKQADDDFVPLELNDDIDLVPE